MAMNVDQEGGGELLSSINTTPLVDVMLVLLIIFLITIPVATHSVPVKLPNQNNHLNQRMAKDIDISITRDGEIYWQAKLLSGKDELNSRLSQLADMQPQPAIHIYGDEESTYAPVGEIVKAAENAGIQKVGFITKPLEGTTGGN